MIESISIQGVASFRSSDVIKVDTNKKIVLFYGHNGTGKSTIARYLQEPTQEIYKNCCHVLPNSQDYQIIVYNTDFVEKNFSQDNLEGIFTLGEANVEAEKAIILAERQLLELEEQRTQKQKFIELQITEKTTKINEIQNKCFQSKREHEKKDLDYCLTGFKSSSTVFYDELEKTKLIETPEYTFETLASESRELNSSKSEPKKIIPVISFDLASIESNAILSEVIVGSSDSYLSKLVNKLKNSNWIDSGRIYINDAEGKCPFCQQIINSQVIKNINDLFDTSYEEKKNALKNLQEKYEQSIKNIENKLAQPDYGDINDKEFDLIKEKFFAVLQANLAKLNQKLADLSIKISLESTRNLVQEINDIISNKNISIIDFNNKLKNKKQSLSAIKTNFWSLLRIKYDADIKAHNDILASIDSDIKNAQKEIDSINTNITVKKDIITENRKKISNIETSITNINTQIKSIGLEGFEIKKTEGSNNYYLCRGITASGNDVYKSLSEGEKTLITYLYFLELCQGRINIGDPTPKDKKIIVVDDPISSLSHNYIYEIGALTHRKLIREYKYAQIIILTHNLYFLHEMIKYIPKDKFEEKCNIFRVVKNTYSNIFPMKKDDIKNDYQSYWQVIKDVKSLKTNNIILPNIMRNILEYYFSFVHKQDDLRIALSQLEETDTEFSSFYRFINRESHSDSINITDPSEIDPERFITKFKKIFVQTGFEEHYNKMMDD